MALARETDVYLAIYELAKYVFDLTTHFKKEDRMTLARRIEDDIIKMGDLVVEANIVEKNTRMDVFNQLKIIIEQFQFIVSLSVERKDISYKQQAAIERHVKNIGKQVTGWKNYTAQQIRRNQIGSQKSTDE